MLFRFTPEELRFVIIDPKVVELQAYSSLPHLTLPIVTDPKKVLLALRGLIDEMERRYKNLCPCRRAKHRRLQCTSGEKERDGGRRALLRRKTAQ